MSAEQDKEIATIRKRNISLNLSDADVERICEKAGRAGLSVSGLLQNFIGDLVCGTYSNGSDERMYAQEWFDRCWFGSYSDNNSLLKYLLECCYDILDYLRMYNEIENSKKPNYFVDPEDKEEELEDLKYWQEQLDEIVEEYKKNCKIENFLIDEEFKKINDYWDEYVQIKGSSIIE